MDVPQYQIHTCFLFMGGLESAQLTRILDKVVLSNANQIKIGKSV